MNPNEVVVVVGQGYVGLPLAQAATLAGFRVHGYDIDADRVKSLNSGRSHIGDLSDVELQIMLESGYAATTDPSAIAEASIIVICVPTPLADDGTPDMTAVRQSAALIAREFNKGALVVLESTTYPGTTENLVLPILEGSGLQHGGDFLLAFSPERVDPGNPEYGIANTPKLVGGLTIEATQKAKSFYDRFVASVVALKGAKEAETAKLLENTYRHVNIALVNEMARLCHDLGVDIWEVIRGAATKPFGFQAFTPGPGVGGHCIPIDPNYLSYEVKRTLGYQFRFVELAQEINNSMPAYIMRRTMDLLNDRGIALRGARVLLLGVTYKPDIADERESPAVPLAKLLIGKGADVRFHDPYVSEWHVERDSIAVERDLNEALSTADITILLQAHSVYDIEAISSFAAQLFDTRGVTSPRETVVRL